MTREVMVTQTMMMRMMMTQKEVLTGTILETVVDKSYLQFFAMTVGFELMLSIN